MHRPSARAIVIDGSDLTRPATLSLGTAFALGVMSSSTAGGTA
jgi:hypothetical protein